MSKDAGTLITQRDASGTVAPGGTGPDILEAIVNVLERSAVLVRRLDGVITHWTAGCESLYGYSRTDAIGKVCQELLRTVMPVPFEEVTQELLRSGSWAGEVEHVRQDGRHLNVSTIWALLRDEAGNPVHIIETNTNITLRIAAQRELEVANEQLRRMAIELERSNGELQEFARIASHDLSAPITSARWLVDLLSMRHASSLNQEGQKCLLQVSQSLSRMSDLVDAVLKHAQVGTASVTTSEAMELSEAVDSALDDLGRQIDLSGAEILYDRLPAIQVERNALNQLFQNLISNAIKYRGADTPAIQISARWEAPWWVISVQDNGIGIDPAWHERIFQPMQRLHGSDVGGSGIGLATCRKIVTRAGGRIWVESEPGEGSTFSFTLPGAEPATP